MKPCYLHTPTWYVYEYPVLTGIPLGTYSYSTNSVNMSGFGSGFGSGYGSGYGSGFGSGYRSLPVQTPYSPAALALQGGRYPATSLSAPNELAYSTPYPSYYNALEYTGSPFIRYGTPNYGYRGLLTAPMA